MVNYTRVLFDENISGMNILFSLTTAYMLRAGTAPGRLIIQDLIILWSNVCVAVLDFKRLNIGVELPGMRLYTFASAKLHGALVFYVFVKQ